MLKFLTTVCFLCAFLLGAGAQGANKTDYPDNPFKNMHFAKGPTDTLTLIVNYGGSFGKLSDKNISVLSSVSKIYKLNVKRFSYAVALKLDGYPQAFYIPCKDKDFINTLSAKQNTVTKVKITCIVYRFFYLDEISNFFYIDKASILERS